MVQLKNGLSGLVTFKIWTGLIRFETTGHRNAMVS